jgi:hypothetical protein
MMEQSALLNIFILIYERGFEQRSSCVGYPNGWKVILKTSECLEAISGRKCIAL